MRQGKREEVETWMKKHNIAILMLQETHSANNSREARGNYTWYFSGEKKLEGVNWVAGVGIVIENKYIQYISDIEPISDRIIRITMTGNLPVTLLGIYLPQAGRPEEEGEEIGKMVEKEIRKWKSKGPLYILGDMNARVQRAEGRREREHIGRYTFEPETASSNRSDMVQRNRTRLIELCQTHGLRLMNTMFKKEEDKLATYAEVGTPTWWPKTRGYPYGYEQIDYIMTTERWKNSIKNVEADPNANITTRHRPVKAKVKIKLKAIRTSNKKRKKYRELEDEENEQWNYELNRVVKKRRRKSVKEEEWEKLNMTEGIERITEILKDATRELKQEPAKERKVNFSETKDILERRKRR